MTHRYLISQDSPALYITIVTKDRLPVFRKDDLKQVLCQAINEARRAFLLFAYVIMVDHLHLLTSRASGTADVLRVLKGITARRVIDYLREKNHSRSLDKLRHRERDRVSSRGHGPNKGRSPDEKGRATARPSRASHPAAKP